MKHLSPLLAATFTMALMACSQGMYPDRSVHVTDNSPVDGVLFWPSSGSGLKYIAVGDTTVIELQGLQRGYATSRVLECSLRFTDSTAATSFFQAHSRIEIPGDPSGPLEPEGLDTALRQVFTRPAGTIVYLQRPAGARTDSALMVSARVYSESLTYVKDTTGKIVKGRFLFRDSTGVHPKRTVQSDSLTVCEILQAAVYTHRGDTVNVRFHRLVLDAALHAALPACSGPHADSISVVLNRFGLPSP